MIKKLRRKFIIINMSLVSLVLVIVFSTLCISNYNRLQSQTQASLERAIDFKQNNEPPHIDFDKDRQKEPLFVTPVFVVTVNSDGDILFSDQKNVTISDENMKQAVKMALETGKERGNISSLDLRFLINETSKGTRIAFADRSNEINSFKNTVLISLLVGFGGFIAFFAVSLFLSNLALRPVEKAWKQQRQFVADASHELKTPLTVILANIDILLSHKEKTVSEQIKWVDNTKEEALQMKSLVDDLLFLAKADGTQAPLVFSEFNLSDSIWNCILNFEPVAYEKGLTFNSEIEDNLTFKGNEGQIRQLISILLDNACKYAGEKGSINVSANRVFDKIQIKVNNTGTPIPRSDIDHIFERFFRADKARTHENGSYGLGLAIAKSITDSHKGEIYVESNYINGTTFTVEL